MTRTMSAQEVNTLIRRKYRCWWFDCRMTEVFTDGILRLTVTPRVPKYHTDAINKIQTRFSKHVLESLLRQLCKEGKLESGEFVIEDKGQTK